METEDQVGYQRGSSAGCDGGGCMPGWVDFFITAAIIAPSDCASRFLIMSRGGEEYSCFKNNRR